MVTLVTKLVDANVHSEAMTLTHSPGKDYLRAMRTPRYVAPQRPQTNAFAVPADAHQVFERERREALARAAAVNAIPSAYQELRPVLTAEMVIEASERAVCVPRGTGTLSDFNAIFGARA